MTLQEARDRAMDQSRHIGIGMAIAAGILMRSWGDETQAREILNAAGFDSVQALRDGDVDQYDIDALAPIFIEVA